MRHAPVVAYPLTTEPRWQGFVASLTAATTLSLTLWALSWLGWHHPGVTVAAGLLAALAAALAWRLARVRPVTLRWTGEQWQLVDGEMVREGVPQVMIDFDQWLLLRWRMESSVLWYAAARATCPAQWHGLRVALSARMPGREP